MTTKTINPNDARSAPAPARRPASRALPVLERTNSRGGAHSPPTGRPVSPPLRSLRPGESAPPVVSFVALGCPKNLVDSEIMLGRLAESGCLISGDEAAADTIVVNTCGFLDASRREALDVLAELAERKRRGRLKRIVVAGCLVQRDGEALLRAVPEIDALVGVNRREDVPAAVWAVSAARTCEGESPQTATECGRSAGTRTAPHAVSVAAAARSAPVDSPGFTASPFRARAPRELGDYHPVSPPSPQPWTDRGRLRLTPRHYAYVRISEGCNQKCTFCTIPSIRGPMHSKPPPELLAESRELIADGTRELILIGQDTTSYGQDIGYAPGLAGLLRELDAGCDGARWIRLMYVYPSVMTDAVIDAIAESPRVVKYIDIPLQHINDRVLRAMHRRVTRRQTEALLETLRRRIPGVTIRTTFIVGFPGETEAEFAELERFVRDFGFDAAGAFQYSLEPETPAARMKDQIADAVKAERYERLMLAQQEAALAAARRRVGTAFEIVVDGQDDRGAIGRHAGQAPEVDSVCILPDAQRRAGQILSVRCVDTDDYDLVVRLKHPSRR